MAGAKARYIAKPVDSNGIVRYTPEENSIWSELINRQIPLVQKYACDEYLRGLKLLNMSKCRIPQCKDVSEILSNTTGWVLEPVPALIPFDQFFHLLANRHFPAATFIRRKEDLDYLEEPDIFHECFGHSPLLTNPAYAEFTHAYGKLALKATHEERVMLARLFWFTIEFGLINTPLGLRAYGGGILSSIKETTYSVESDVPERKKFNVTQALSTVYHIDTLQPVYFVIDDFETLFELVEMDLIGLIHKIHK